MNVVKEKIIKTIYIPHIITSLGVRMQNPMDENGRWIGWLQRDIDKHLQSVRNYIATLPPPPKQNGNGC
jgi:hypothetical protein